MKFGRKNWHFAVMWCPGTCLQDVLKIRLTSLRFVGPKFEFWTSQRRSMVFNYSIQTLYGVMMFHRSLMMLPVMMIYKLIKFHNDGGSYEDKLVHDVIRCEYHRVWW
jgi:hypothetical protein